MTNLCMLITKLPHSSETADHVFGTALKAGERGQSVSVYLLGEGVYCAKKGLKEGNVRQILDGGVKVFANAKDLRARGLVGDRIEPGVEQLDNFEHVFVKDMAENSDRVISW